MENGVEALKIVFGIIIFVLAISISISCFTQAVQAMHRIWEMQQADESYITDANGNYLHYVNFNGGTRDVSAETIVPNMYRAYKENFAIYFYDATGNKLELYKNSSGEMVNYLDLEKEVHSNEETAIQHLNEVLKEGLYDSLKGSTFIEYLGEYYQEDVSGITETADVNKSKKRIIAYKLK